MENLLQGPQVPGPWWVPDLMEGQPRRLQRVRGAVVDLVFTAEPQALELRVDPTHWLDLVDFSELLQGAPSNGVFTWGPHSTFLNSLVQGVKGETGIYQFQLVPR